MKDNSISLQKILSRTLKSDECLLWQGSRNNDGYGTITFHGKHWKVHRLIYFLNYGFVKDYVLHACDVTNCIEIGHLFLGTQDDNMKDAALKGRLVKGEIHPKALLNRDKVEYIRSFYEKGKAPYGTRKKLAKELDVSYWTIDQVLRNTTWK